MLGVAFLVALASLRNFPIYVLDELDAALDPENQKVRGVGGVFLFPFPYRHSIPPRTHAHARTYTQTRKRTRAYAQTRERTRAYVHTRVRTRARTRTSLRLERVAVWSHLSHSLSCVCDSGCCHFFLHPLALRGFSGAPT